MTCFARWRVENRCHSERSVGSIDDQNGVEEPSLRDSAGAEVGGATDTSNIICSSDASTQQKRLILFPRPSEWTRRDSRFPARASLPAARTGKTGPSFFPTAHAGRPSAYRQEADPPLWQSGPPSLSETTQKRAAVLDAPDVLSDALQSAA